MLGPVSKIMDESQGKDNMGFVSDSKSEFFKVPPPRKKSSFLSEDARGFVPPSGGIKGSLKLYLIIWDVSPIRYNPNQRETTIFFKYRVEPDDQSAQTNLARQGPDEALYLASRNQDGKYKVSTFLPPDLGKKARSTKNGVHNRADWRLKWTIKKDVECESQKTIYLQLAIC